jgi:hypothetical protein
MSLRRGASGDRIKFLLWLVARSPALRRRRLLPVEKIRLD